MKSKIKPKGIKHDRTDSGPGEHVVVFGTQRIGAIYALRNGIDPRRIILCTQGVEALRGIRAGGITVVRVTQDAWQPTTNPCATRTREVEQALKEGVEAKLFTIKTVRLD